MQLVRNLVIAAMMVVMGASVFAQTGLSRQAKKDVYEQATDLYQKEKYAAAQHLFDQVAADADNGEACYYAAVCSEKLNNNDALYRIEEFLRLYPQSGHCNMARMHMGNFYYARSQYAQALQCYRQVNGNEVEYGYKAEYEFKMGYCYFVAGDYNTAKSYFSRLQSGKSKYRNSALYYYAHIQYMDHEYELALKSFDKLKGDRKFAKIVPNYMARIYYYLGREDELLEMTPELLQQKDAYRRDEIAEMAAEVYFNRSDYKRALEFYNKSTSLMVADGQEGSKKNACSPQDNYYQIGYCYYMMHKYDSAAVYLSRKTTCADSISQNAMYTLGDTYVRLDRKNEARSMFLQASTMDFDPKIKEDALFNYAKLSCELNINPYNESIRSFEDYLRKYPKTSHKTEVQEILTSLYLTTKNYKDAIVLIEKIPNRNAQLNQAYQRCLVNRGIELFNEFKPKEASDLFAKAIKLNVVPKVTTDAQYLYAEAQYRMGSYPSARKAIERFLLSSSATLSSYYPQGLYTAGYLYMKDENYDDAQECFEKYLTTSAGWQRDHQTYDVYNRLGDCRYVSRNFAGSIDYYDKVIEANDKDADYATYQKAMAYGAIGKNPEKLTYLNYIFERYKGSQFSSKAMLEIANTYLACDNNDMALLYYGNFIKQYPNSSYVKEALLSMGLIYYNTDKYDESLKTFDRLLNKYPGTPESRDALSTVKSIYVEQNRVDEYFDYVGKTAHIDISVLERDSTTFMAVESRYQDGDCEKAVKGFENYLKKFPKGLFHLQAHYYMADCLFRSGNGAEALPHYEAVASVGKNKYTETSLYNGADIAYTLGDYQKSLQLYERLLNTSESDNSRLQSRVGILRCWVKLDNNSREIQAADALIAEPKVTTELLDEANLCKARAYYADGDLANALSIYTILRKSTNGDYSGEAYYTQALTLYNEHEFDQAERLIEGEIIDNSHSDYWLAKTFILWADIYYARGNSLQAKQTLQSIIDNYDGEELVQIALSKRNAIIEAEAPVQHQEDDELVITIDDDEPVPFIDDED